MSDDTISRQDARMCLTGDVTDMGIEQYIKMVDKRLEQLPSAQPKKRTEERTETHACDLISRQAAIDAIVAQTIGYTVDEIKAECEENIFNENGYLGGLKDAINAIEDMPPAQQEVLACGEGELIAQPEIVRCKDCKYWNDEFAKDKSTCWLPCMSMTTHREWHCGSAERRTDDGE